MTDSQAVVLESIEDGVATLTLNRPTVLNAMGGGILESLVAKLERIAADQSVRVLVLTGAGRGFCAGADLAESSSGPTTQAGEGADLTEEQKLEAMGDATAEGMDSIFHPAIKALMNFPVPTVARINGVAAGAGIGLALACDITVAAHSASFVSTFAPRLGLVPDLGAGWQMARRVGRARAMGMAMLGDKIRAEQAADWGLVWQAVPDEELDAAVAVVTDRLRKTSANAMVRTRELIDDAVGRGMDDQLDAERDHQRVLVPINMGPAAQAFIDKTEPEFNR